MKISPPFTPSLDFAQGTPRASRGLGGLIRDHFANGRIFATVGHHGGLTNIAYWGKQHLGAAQFFQGALETGWHKLFRLYVRVGEKRHYPIFHETTLYPFGLESRDVLDGLPLDYQLLLLPDALVQRVRFPRRLGGKVAQLGLLHQEAINATGGSNREWQPFKFGAKLNAFTTSCLDLNPPEPELSPEEQSLAQSDRGPAVHDSPRVTTWIGLGCTEPLTVKGSYHPRGKQYLEGGPFRQDGSFFLVFADSQSALKKRLRELSRTVGSECNHLLRGYTRRLQDRPKIDVGNAVLNSAFQQYPEMIQAMRIPDEPGAVRATLAGYFVWGWDGMMPLLSSPWANETEDAAASLQFYHRRLDPRFGIPHSFTTDFQLKLKTSFPSQCQFIAMLYHYVAFSGDLSMVRKVFSTCTYILDRCRENLVGDTGLVSGAALWPDFPEALEENGHDISSVNNSLLYQGLRAMEYLADAIGHSERAVECRSWARKLRFHFVKHLYDAEKGYFISSCSSVDFSPRKHYCCQAVFWLTPFARELVSHAPGTIARFMDQNLRSPRCLLSLPLWDTAWMADGNQLGSSYPAADSFYLNVHKLVGDASGLKAWMGDVEWFWRHHTAPEAFTPEADNEEEFGPDNWGGKQAQACATWYAGLYTGLAGLDVDHEGITLAPLGNVPVTIAGLHVRGFTLDLQIRGRGPHLASVTVNGLKFSPGLQKIAWSDFKKKRMRLELVRTSRALRHPVILRADGLRIGKVVVKGYQLTAGVSGTMSGEIVVCAPEGSKIRLQGELIAAPFDPETGTFSIPFSASRERADTILEVAA